VNDTFEPEDGLTARLRALGQLPIDSATQSRHLTAMAEAAAAPSLLGTLGNRIRIAVALVVGFMLGTTGLASAGALGPLQPIASSTLEKVGINVPEGDDVGTKRIREGCEAVEFKNHGQYLKAVREQFGKDSPQFAAAKESDCGKPVASLNGDDDEAETSEPDDKSDSAPGGKGKPDSPGKSGEKGKSGDKSSAPAGGDASGKAEAACAGGPEDKPAVDGEAVAAAAPVTSAPGMPEQLLNFFQREAERLGLLDKPKSLEDVGRIPAQAAGRARRPGHQSLPLVIAQRFDGHSALPGHFADPIGRPDGCSHGLVTCRWRCRRDAFQGSQHISEAAEATRVANPARTAPRVDVLPNPLSRW